MKRLCFVSGDSLTILLMRVSDLPLHYWTIKQSLRADLSRGGRWRLSILLRRSPVKRFQSSSLNRIVVIAHHCSKSSLSLVWPPQRFVVVASSRVGVSWRIHAIYQGYRPLAAFSCSTFFPWRVANSRSGTVLGVTILLELSEHFYPPGLRLPSHLSTRQAPNKGSGRVRNKATEKTRLGMRCAD